MDRVAAVAGIQKYPSPVLRSPGCAMASRGIERQLQRRRRAPSRQSTPEESYVQSNGPREPAAGQAVNSRGRIGLLQGLDRQEPLSAAFENQQHAASVSGQGLLQRLYESAQTWGNLAPKKQNPYYNDFCLCPMWPTALNKPGDSSPDPNRRNQQNVWQPKCCSHPFRRSPLSSSMRLFCLESSC